MTAEENKRVEDALWAVKRDRCARTGCGHARHAHDRDGCYACRREVSWQKWEYRCPTFVEGA